MPRVAKKTELKIQMYGTKELPKELRTSFKLSGDPYDVDEPLHKASGLEAVKYLRDLGIVFYRDEEHAAALIIEPSGQEGSILEETGWLAYKHLCVIKLPDRSINQWPIHKTPNKKRDRAVYVKKVGDDSMWLQFNKPLTVLTMSDTRVSTA